MGARAEAGFRGQQATRDIEEEKSRLTTRQESAKKKVEEAKTAIQTGVGTNLTPEEIKSIEEQRKQGGEALGPARAKSTFIAIEKRKKEEAKGEVLGLGVQISAVAREPKFGDTVEAKEAAQEKLRATLTPQTSEADKKKVDLQILSLQYEKEYLQTLKDGAVAAEARSNELRSQAEGEQRLLSLADLRANAELEIARARGTPAEISRKTFIVQQRILQDEMAEGNRAHAEEVARLQGEIDKEGKKPQTPERDERLKQLGTAQQAAGIANDTRNKDIQARISENQRNEFERQRDIEVTRVQEDTSTKIVAAKFSGNVQERQRLEDQQAFLTKFNELRGQFGEPEAAQRAIESRKTQLMEEAPIATAPVASSLTRIGGGGGVSGPTGDPIVRINQRMATLQGDFLPFLRSIDQKAGAQTGVSPGATPATPVAQIPGTPGIASTTAAPGTATEAPQASSTQVAAQPGHPYSSLCGPI